MSKKKTIQTQKNRRVQCRKSHGHLICWINPRNTRKKPRLLFNLIIPGTHNKHTPYLIRSPGLILVAFLLIGLQLVYNYDAIGKAKILGYATNVSSGDVVASLNKAREDAGLEKLKVDETLGEAASMKASDMFENGYWSHDSPNGTKPWHWYQKAGYGYQAAGENLAKGFQTSKALTSAWMHSESHKENIMNPDYRDVGIAVVNGNLAGEETTLVVAHFGVKKSEAAPATAQSENQPAILSSTIGSSRNIFSNPAYISALSSPISLASILILLAVMVVAALAHWHYIRLPRKVRRAWYKHHGLYAGMLACLGIVYVAYIFSSGSI